MTSTATVIIVNYNGAHLLPACLDGLRSQTGRHSFDTVVVDNASSDGSRELLARDYPEVRVLANADNLGFAGGNNVALEQVRTPYAVLLNNDAVPEPEWLDSLLDTFSEPGNEDLGIATGKILFLPKFVGLRLDTEGFVPGTADTRELGARLYRVTVDGQDVTEKVMWEQAVYGPEGEGEGRYRWSRPTGEFLLPVPATAVTGGALNAAVEVRVSLAADEVKPFTVGVVETTAGAGASAAVETRTGGERVELALSLPAGTSSVDVINNVGGQVFEEGSGGDRGFQQVDRGQYETEEEVFTACGNGMAMRTMIGQQLGWFDAGFFMYYEDTDLSWRWRSVGWSIRYQPRAVLRHIHSASSKEWSPRWIFHVERNRLLMLTKNATAGLAFAAVLQYLKDVLRETLQAARMVTRRQRPPLRRLQVKYQVLASFTRRLPGALRARIILRRKAKVNAKALQHWLVER